VGEERETTFVGDVGEVGEITITDKVGFETTPVGGWLETVGREVVPKDTVGASPGNIAIVFEPMSKWSVLKTVVGDRFDCADDFFDEEGVVKNPDGSQEGREYLEDWMLDDEIVEDDFCSFNKIFFSAVNFDKNIVPLE